MPIGIGIAAGTTALTAWVGGAAASTIVSLTIISATIATIQELIERHRKQQNRRRSSDTARDPTERNVFGGIKVAAWVMGRQKINENDFQLCYVARQDVPVDRRVWHEVYILAEGPVEGIEKIELDGHDAATGTPNGNKQYLVPAQTNPDDLRARWEEIWDEKREDDPDYDDRDEVFEELKREGQNRFRAIDNNYVDYGPWCQFYFYPDGVENNQYQATLDIPGWKETEYKYKGLAVLHCWFEKSALDSPFAGPPRIDVVLKGSKITWPGQVAHTWTENAAAISAWFLNKRMGVAVADIDRTEFDLAYAKCNETITFDLDDPDDEYTKTVPQYTINQLIVADPNYNIDYIRNFEQAMQGVIYEDRGKAIIRAGYDRPATFNIDKKNIIQRLGFQPQTAIRDRVNAIRATIPQSIDHDYNAYDLPVVEDASARATLDGGKYLEIELENLESVAYPLAAINIQNIFLRRARAPATLEYRILAGPIDFDGNDYSGQVKNMDVCHVTDPEIGLNNARYEVVSQKFNQDWSMDLLLQEAPLGRFSKTNEIPELKPRKLIPPSPRTLPEKPTGLTATGGSEILADGTLNRFIDIAWNTNNYSTEFVIEHESAGFKQSAVALGFQSSVKIMIPVNGNYNVIARHVNRFNRRSLPATASTNVTTNTLIPPVPRYATHDIRGSQVIVFFRPYTDANFDVSGMQVKYRVMDLTSTTNFPAKPANESEWDALPNLQAESIIPAAQSDNYSLTFSIPYSGRYKFYVRAITRQGAVSEILEMNEFILAGVLPPNTTVNLAPGFPGTRTNLNNIWDRTITASDGTEWDLNQCLFRDSSAIRSLSRDDLNGKSGAQGGWPFSSRAPNQFSTNSAILRTNPTVQLPEIGNYKAKFQAKFLSPVGVGTLRVGQTISRAVFTMQGLADGRSVVASRNVGGSVTEVGTNYYVISNDFQTFRSINEIATGIQFPASSALCEFFVFVEVIR